MRGFAEYMWECGDCAYVVIENDPAEADRLALQHRYHTCPDKLDGTSPWSYSVPLTSSYVPPEVTPEPREGKYEHYWCLCLCGLIRGPFAFRENAQNAATDHYINTDRTRGAIRCSPIVLKED